MYDSIEAMYLPSKRLSDSMWSDERVTRNKRGEVIKRWYNSRDGALRLNYWQGDDSNVLKCSFDVPRVVGLSGRDNVTNADRDAAYERVNQWLSNHFGDLPYVQSWQAQRIDYAFNWRLGSRALSYLRAFQRLDYGNRARTTYRTGVSWLGGKHGRSVVVYLKDDQIGDGLNDGVLRYEVQSKRGACAYMSKHWFACSQTVGDLAHEGRALYVLARVWQRLGLDVQRSYVERSELRSRLRDTYGSSAGAAWNALDLITMYGRQCVSLDLISENNYYTWRRRLRADGYLAPLADVLTDGSDELIALHLPARDIISSLAQNLESSSGGSLSFLLKNSWEKLAGILGISPDAVPSEYLLRFFDE